MPVPVPVRVRVRVLLGDPVRCGSILRPHRAGVDVVLGSPRPNAGALGRVDGCGRRHRASRRARGGGYRGRGGPPDVPCERPIGGFDGYGARESVREGAREGVARGFGQLVIWGGRCRLCLPSLGAGTAGGRKPLCPGAPGRGSSGARGAGQDHVSRETLVPGIQQDFAVLSCGTPDGTPAYRSGSRTRTF